MKIIILTIVKKKDDINEEKEMKSNNHFFHKDNLENKLSGKKIIEVVNNIDTSSYLKDEDSNKDTNLLTEYQMPTLEIIYIIQ